MGMRMSQDVMPSAALVTYVRVRRIRRSIPEVLNFYFLKIGPEIVCFKGLNVRGEYELRCVCHCRCVVFRLEEIHIDVYMSIDFVVCFAFGTARRHRGPHISGAGSLVQGWLSSPLS